MQDELQNIVEKEKIIDTINALFIGTDQRDWVWVKKCFAPAVYFDMTSVAPGKPATLTPKEIVDGWRKGLKPLKAIHHQAGNFVVRVTGDEATAFCYAIALHYLPNPSGRNTRTFVGSYDFHLIKKRERWQIDLFKFNLKYIDGNLNLEKSQAGAA
ncbi:MAG: nuclear transport factor 2 family protein [Nitrospirae bacterium]|nr:nuclear transport factor 2 family protein [Candidatus Manganitrophaceae bacterium]